MYSEVLINSPGPAQGNTGGYSVAESIYYSTHTVSEMIGLSEAKRNTILLALRRFGLEDNSNLLIIPHNRHFFYEEDDLRGIRTVVNLKPLNNIKSLRDFIRSISELLPEDCNLIGWFTDNRHRYDEPSGKSEDDEKYNEREEAIENGIESRIPFINRMYSFIDLRPDHFLTSRSVAALFNDYGLRVVRMIDLNGRTYFHARKRERELIYRR